MIENNLLTVIGDKTLEYPNEIGARHLDMLNKACKNLNLNTNISNEFELALFLAQNKQIVGLNSYGAIILVLPEKLNEFQIDFLISQKEKYYEKIMNDEIIEVAIATTEPVAYNGKKLYRDLSIELQIASYEVRKIDSQLDILYEFVESQKAKCK